MLGTSIYLCDDVVQAVRGRPRRGRLEIASSVSVPIPEGCLVRGEIRDAGPLRQALAETTRRLGGEMKRADVLVNNSLIRVKAMKLPKMRSSQISRFVRMEMGVPYKNPGEYSFDYSVLDPNKEGVFILGGAMRLEWLTAYRRLFEECGIGLCSLGPALTGLTRLVGFLPEWKDKNLLLVHQEDEEDVLLALFRSGRYLASNRVFCQGGVCTDKGRTRLLGQITAFYYMQEARNSGFTLDGVALCGRFHEEDLLCRELLAALGEKVCRLQESRAIDVRRAAAGRTADVEPATDARRATDADCAADTELEMGGRYRLTEYFCVTGNLLRR